MPVRSRLDDILSELKPMDLVSLEEYITPSIDDAKRMNAPMITLQKGRHKEIKNHLGKWVLYLEGNGWIEFEAQATADMQHQVGIWHRELPEELKPYGKLLPGEMTVTVDYSTEGSPYPPPMPRAKVRSKYEEDMQRLASLNLAANEALKHQRMQEYNKFRYEYERLMHEIQRDGAAGKDMQQRIEKVKQRAIEDPSFRILLAELSSKEYLSLAELLAQLKKLEES